MYKSSYSSFFLGANTPKGFYSLFDELYFPEDGWRLYIIKGGPGTGKSTLIKKVAAKADSFGHYSERIYCSSDPESLDALILPHMKISVCDGASPHVVEPKFPGISEVFIDLGAFRNDKELKKNSNEIINATKANSLQHKKCVDFLAAAACVDNDTNKIILSALRIDRLHKFADKLAFSQLSGAADTKGKESKRFLSALTPKGSIVFINTFNDMCEKRIILEDNFGIASSVILKALAFDAKERGYNCILCYCPMAPELKLEHMIIPDLSLGFFTSNRLHPYTDKKDKTIDCLRFCDREILIKHKNRLAFNSRSRNELLAEAANNLGKAKEIHDCLEKLYYPAIDFEGIQKYGDKIVEEIFS